MQLPLFALSALALAGTAGAQTAITPVTFAEHVAPIIFENCTECHRPGEGAPFSFLDYEDVRKRGKMINVVTDSGYMPPWHPVEGHGEFEGQRGLTTGELGLLERWVEEGMLSGDLTTVPELPKFVSGWKHGEPDLVLEMEEAFEIPADGPDIYRNFVLPVDLPEDAWITAIEVRPSARTVVHHVLFFHDASGTARRLDEADSVPGFEGMGLRMGRLGGWAVGGSPYALPGGLAMPLPAESDIVIQTHFHPSGKAETERTKLGIFISRKAPERTVVSLQLPPNYAAFHGLDVPAGEDAFTLIDSMVLPVDTDLVTVGAHAHYIGKSMISWATLPDGTRQKLFYIDDWDFNWQGRYLYREPVRLPAGTRVDVELVYDNSAANVHNPFNPPQRISWGLESTDEMGAITWVAVAADEADTDELRSAVGAKFASARRNRSRVTVDLYSRLMRLDADGDGRISAEEIPDSYRRGLERLDSNGDGELDEKELEVVRRQSGGR